jgi:hypothetical protein
LADSLILAEQIELLGGGAVSTLGPASGAMFRLGQGWSAGAPDPTSDYVASLVLDGERPTGRRASNRLITLPITIMLDPAAVSSVSDADRFTLAAARELLVYAVNQEYFTLKWTREGGLPLVFDCYRNNQAQPVYVLPYEKQGYLQLTVSFPALPYGRSDVPQTVNFQSPIAGFPAPPSAVTIDPYTSVSGTNWTASSNGPSGSSAYWNPAGSPDDNPAGTGSVASYSKTGLTGINLAQGWDISNAGTPSLTDYFIIPASDASLVAAGQTFQVWNSGQTALIYNTIFTITSISPPSGGDVSVFFSPGAPAVIASGDKCVQVGPPNLNALTLWVAFGSTSYFRYWCQRGGPVVFTFTLTDTYGTVLTFSKTYPQLFGSNNSSLPKWTKIRVPVPSSTTFDYANVAAYSVTVSNRGTGDLAYTQLYIDSLTAVPPTTPVATPQRGVVYDLAGMVGTARSMPSLQFQQAGSDTLQTLNLTQPGSQYWLCPYGVTAISQVFCIGGGGTGPSSPADGTGGGSGGSSAIATSVAVTAGNAYLAVVGAGGTPAGAAPGLSSFTGDSVTVSAPGGKNSTSSTGAAANSAGTPAGYAGGAGGAGTDTTSGGGGGGGTSAGTAAAGTTGNAASGGTGGAYQTSPPSGGYDGGRGGSYGFGNGVPAGGAYGGACGGSPGRATGYFYSGNSGLVQLEYLAPPVFKTLLVHRPGYRADPNLCPYVTPNPGDAPNGTFQYPVPSLTAGLNARFNGTYSVYVVNQSWAAPSSPVTVTVTVTQWEQPFGSSYAQSVAWTFTPSALLNSSPFVCLGNLTIPLNELPPENTNAYYTVSITDTNTSDTYYDILFLDTQGSTVIVTAANEYAAMWIDEPYADRDIGMVLGSVFDRSTAISLMQGSVVSGGPVTVDPDGNQSLLCYAVEGAPSVQMTYFPRWFMDRLA